jgi:hypothetical protein
MKLIKSRLPLVWIVCGAALSVAFRLQVCPAQTGTVTGVVVEDRDSAAVMGGVVKLAKAEASAYIDESSRYIFRNLRPGNDTLRVRALGYYSITCPIMIKSDTVTIVDFVLTEALVQWDNRQERIVGGPPSEYDQQHSVTTFCPRLNTIRGKVFVDLDSIALVNASVASYRVGGEVNPRYPIARTSTDASGAFVFRDLIPGQYRLQVRTKGYEAEDRVVKLDEDSDVVSDFYLSPAREK